MPTQSSAAKRHRQSERRRIKNRSLRSEVRSGIRKFHTTVAAKNREEADTQLRVVIRLIDSAARKGIYHANNAARTKSRLHAKLHAME